MNSWAYEVVTCAGFVPDGVGVAYEQGQIFFKVHVCSPCFVGGLFSWVGRVFVSVVCARKLLKGVSASQVNPWVTTPLPSPAAKAAPVVLPDPAPVWSPGGIDLEQMPLEVKSGLVKGSGLVLVGAHGGAGTSTWARLMELKSWIVFLVSLSR